MISKWKINLIAFLISLTLFSVGFSSWQITNSAMVEDTGIIQVDSVVKAPDDVRKLVDFVSVDCFEYGINGFVLRDEKGFPSTTKTATVTANFILYPTALQEHFSSYDATALSVEAVLTYENAVDNATLFVANHTYIPNANYGGTTLDYLTTSHTNGYRFSVVLTDILTRSESEIALAMNFSFTVNDSDYQAFYNAINSDSFQFNVSANLTTYAEATA